MTLNQLTQNNLINSGTKKTSGLNRTFTVAMTAAILSLFTACNDDNSINWNDPHYISPENLKTWRAYTEAQDTLIDVVKHAKKEISWDFTLYDYEGNDLKDLSKKSDVKVLGSISEDSLKSNRLIIDTSRGGLLKEIAINNHNEQVDLAKTKALTDSLNYYLDSNNGRIHLVREGVVYRNEKTGEYSTENKREVVFVFKNKKPQ